VPGQLLIDGHIKAVVPAEDAKAFEAANPVQADGRIVFDEKANEAREDAIVTRMMKASGTAVLVEDNRPAVALTCNLMRRQISAGAIPRAMLPVDFPSKSGIDRYWLPPFAVVMMDSSISTSGFRRNTHGKAKDGSRQ
jgi:hypothetical protein